MLGAPIGWDICRWIGGRYRFPSPSQRISMAPPPWNPGTGNVDPTSLLGRHKKNPALTLTWAKSTPGKWKEEEASASLSERGGTQDPKDDPASWHDHDVTSSSSGEGKHTGISGYLVVGSSLANPGKAFLAARA